MPKAEKRCRDWAGDRFLLDLGVKMEERENGDVSVAVSQPWVSVEPPACPCVSGAVWVFFCF